jgi:hypothetical protein
VCSSKADGFCNGIPCLAFPEAGPPDLAPYDGDCLALCAGKCTAGHGTGATDTCNGQCTAAAANVACDGICIGDCSGTRTDVSCQGTLSCPQQNAECGNACGALAALKTTCADSPTSEVYAVSDAALTAAFRAHAAKFGKAVAQLAVVRKALGFVGDRAYGDFVAIGLKGSLIQKCVTAGNADVKDANDKIASVLAADPTTRKAQGQ